MSTPPIVRHAAHTVQIFLTFFKTLEGKEVVVELKNDLQIKGVLATVDQYLNLKLSSVSIVDKDKYPQLLSVKTVFIRGSVVRYVHVPPDAVDTELLQDAARRESMEAMKATTVAAGGVGGRR